MTQINFVGGAYQHPALPANNQRALNCYPVVPGPDGRGKATLLQRAGKRTLTTLTGASEVRGMLAINNKIYILADVTLYDCTYDITSKTILSAISVGTINNAAGAVSMAANTHQIIIVNGSSEGWIYSPMTYVSVTRGPIGGTASDTYNLTINGTAIYTAENVTTALTDAALVAKINTLTGTTGITADVNGTGVITLTNDDSGIITVSESGTGFTAGTDGLTISTGMLSTGSISSFTQITDPNFMGGSSVAFLDGYFFIAQPNTNKFYASAINDGLTYDALDFASAEINQNFIKTLAVKNRQLWIFKDNYTEVWFDAANESGMPLSPRVGSELSIGTIAASSVVSTDNTLYWLDNRGFVVAAISSDAVTNQTTGNAAKVVSTDALHIEWAGYGRIDDAIATGYVERGHLMYQINFPTEQKSWVYDLTTGEWHERSFYIMGTGTRLPDTAYYSVQVGIDTIVAGGSAAGQISRLDPLYKYDGSALIECIRTTPHIFDDFNLLEISQLELKCVTGNATQSGLGSDPHISMRYSIDSGHTWSASRAESLGLVGQYNKRVQWNRLGTASEFIFEFTITEPIDWAIVDASIITNMEQD